MRQVIAIAVALASVTGLVRSASAEAMTCEQRFQTCLDKTPWGQSGEKCLRAVLKCEADARNNPDAITSAGPRVPRGEKPTKPGKGGTKLTSSGSRPTNVGALAAVPGLVATKPAGVAVSGVASPASATSNANRAIGKSEAVPPQLADRLRRLHR